MLFQQKYELWASVLQQYARAKGFENVYVSFLCEADHQDLLQIQEAYSRVNGASIQDMFPSIANTYVQQFTKFSFLNKIRLVDEGGQLDTQTISAFAQSCKSNAATSEDILAFVVKLEAKSLRPVLDAFKQEVGKTLENYVNQRFSAK